MLSTDFRFGATRWSQRLLRFLLGEHLLGFLALMAAALTLFPMLFAVPPVALNALGAAQWMIVAWFAVEYVVALVSARSKRLFLTDPWRWIDFATIVIPLASMLPATSNLLRSSPVLRLARLARLLTLGVRASGIVVRQHSQKLGAGLAAGPARITRRDPAAPAEATSVSRDALLAWLGAGDQGWYHVTNPAPEDLAAIAVAAKLPAGFIETHLLTATHPHLATSGECTALFLWSPEPGELFGAVERRPILLLIWPDRVLTLSRLKVRALETLAQSAPDAARRDAALPMRVATAVVERIVDDNETLVGGFEQQLRALEDMPLRESRPAFFEQTFRLKKQLSAAQWDLWRLKALLTELAGADAPLPGADDAGRRTFSRLAASADYLYETIVNTREDLLAVIDLHLNVVSFDMNRVMRVLAVVSVLGLIPAVIGGLLGMNLVDNPWHFTLPQVTFVIGFGMLSGLYFFLVKGWLR